jgi:hypothetical protein
MPDEPDVKAKRTPIDSAATTRLVFLVLGAAMLIPMLLTHVQQQAFARVARSAVGTVTYVETRTSGRGTSEHPTIAYTSEDGRPRSFTAPDSSIGRRYKVNDRVIVLYHPDRPWEAVIEKDNSLLTNEVMLLISCMGCGMLTCGVLPTFLVLFGLAARRTTSIPQ